MMNTLCWNPVWVPLIPIEKFYKEIVLVMRLAQGDAGKCCSSCVRVIKWNQDVIETCKCRAEVISCLLTLLSSRWHFTPMFYFQISHYWHNTGSGKNWIFQSLMMFLSNFCFSVLTPEFCVTDKVYSVKCYHGGLKIPLISSIFEIQSQMWYHCIQYTRRHHISLFSYF